MSLAPQSIHKRDFDYIADSCNVPKCRLAASPELKLDWD